MNAAAYIRVSSASQNDAMQRTAILRAAKARGDTIRPADFYADTMSGKQLARPALERLRAAVRAGEVRKVYVYKLDRLTRSGIRDTLGIVEEFRGHGCELTTLADEGFDTSGPAAQVVVAVLAWAAQIERQAISDRLVSARKRVEAEGRKWGRPKRMLNSEVAHARELRDEGETHRRIAIRLKIPKSTITRALGRNPPPKKTLSAPAKRKGKRPLAQ